MATVVNIGEAKTHLSRLLERVAAGEEIVIAKANRPVAKLVAVPPAVEDRVLGRLRGQIRIADDFDAPDPGIEDLFHDGPIDPEP